MQRVEKVSFSSLSTAFKEFGSTIRRLVPFRQAKQDYIPDDEFNRSDSKPRSSEERAKTAVIKSNEANRERLVAEINRSGEIDSVYDKLLPEYAAYANPELKDLEFSPDSANIVSATYKRKPVEIRCNIHENGNKEQEISFADGSKIKYITFSQNGEMVINGEEFKMPAGTIVETKSINGRVFSQLIQTPDMKRNVINKPEYIDEAEKILTAHGAIQKSEVMPEAEASDREDLVEDFLTTAKNLKEQI